MPQFTPQQPSIAPPTDMFQTSSFQLPATTVTSAVQPSTVLLGMSAPTANVQPAFSVPQADEELFGALDFDANGKITRESFINAATEGWEDPNKSLFDEFDLGKDGLISREEFIAAAMGEVIHEPRDDVKPEQLFVLRDMDGELTNGGGDVFSRFDKDADGKISKEEFLEALAGQQRDPELGLRVLDAEGRDFRIQGLNFCGFPVKAELAFDDDDDINSNNFGGMKLDPLKVDLSGLNLHALVPGLPEIPEYDWNANCADRCLMRCDATCDIYENFCGSCCFRLEQLFGYGCINSMLSFFTGKMTWLFTLLCILLFGLPIWIIDRIGKDMQVKYWITDMLFIVWLLPCLYILTHIVHSKRSNPSRTMVIICLIGSCIWLLILGDFVLVKAYSRANVLISKDCTSDLAKSYLQVQWENAQVFYQNCMEETALSTGSSLEVAYSLYRIQDCQGYLGQLVANPAWPYLGALEDEYQCGGWCLRKQPLWTFKSVKDSCSATVADVLYTKVQWFTLQVVVYSTIVLVLVSFALIQTGPILRSHSIEW